jgi:MYXO-CTERM domain-containing protein
VEDIMRLRSIGVGAVLVGSLFAASRAHAADTGAQAGGPCDPGTLLCSTGTGSFTYQSKDRIFTDIDTGSQGSGRISVRARFSIDPVGNEPSIVMDMTKGALVHATWPEKGYLTLKPVTAPQAEGSIKVRYTLTPSLEANIYGFNISYSAAQLAARVGGSFNYDVSGQQKIVPWGFTPAALQMPGPALDQSRIFQIGLAELGVPTDVVEGVLSLHATTKPTFTYKTKEIRLDSGSVTNADGTVKIPATDADFMDVTAFVSGDLTMNGTMDVKPYVNLDTVAGYPTFGLVKFSFSVASKAYTNATGPKAIGWQAAQVHIPLPNIKVPNKPVDMGEADPGGETEQTIVIDSTGELGGLLSFTSSDPAFVVPQGQVKVGSKEQYELKVKFRPGASGGASAEITVKSNDPDSPEQTFRVAANGAPLDPSNPDGEKAGKGKGGAGPTGGLPEPDSGSCACTTVGGSAPSSYGAVGLVALGLAAVLRRRRR